jgi:hypothetical protein
MPIPTHLAELRLRLEAVGMVVVEEPDHLTIRLPFLCSVRVYGDAERLRMEGHFGVYSRVRSTMLKLGGLTTLAVALGRLGLAYAGVVALLALIAGIYDSIRWQITEHAITRISTIATITTLATASPGSLMLGFDPDRTLRPAANTAVPNADRAFTREHRDD